MEDQCSLANIIQIKSQKFRKLDSSMIINLLLPIFLSLLLMDVGSIESLSVCIRIQMLQPQETQDYCLIGKMIGGFFAKDFANFRTIYQNVVTKLLFLLGYQIAIKYIFGHQNSPNCQLPKLDVTKYPSDKQTKDGNDIQILG